MTRIEIDDNTQSSGLFVKVRIILVVAFCSLDLLILAVISGIEQRFKREYSEFYALFWAYCVTFYNFKNVFCASARHL